MAYFFLRGMFGWIVRFMLALSVIAWALYGVTILWERENRKILIMEKGSMYALGAEYGDEVPPGGMQADGQE
jgi:high-affinity Fe2+/Pb2+ permease